MSEPTPISSPELDEHLGVDGVNRELKHRSARGGLLMVASYAVQLLIGIGTFYILARVLTPSDFGYLAMVATVANLVVSFREFLIAPTVQMKDLSHEQASSLFWVNCVVSVALAILIAAIAPFLVWLFKEPRLLNIGLVLALGVLLHMLGMMHMGVLRRQMQFGVITFIEVGAMIAGSITGIGMALRGAGYWALVMQQVVVWTWQSAASWWLCAWRPSRASVSAIRDPAVRSMLRYGQDSTTSRIIIYISRNTDNMFVGYFLGASVLGLYQKAYQWAMMPFWQIFLPMTPVAVSSFSRIQDDPARYRQYAHITLLGMFSLALPAIALLMVESDNTILFLMGKQWIDAIPMLRMQSIGAYFSSFTLVTMWLYLPEGRTWQQLKWSIFSAPVTMIAVGIGVKWGAVGVSTGFAIASFLLVPIGVWYCLKGSPLTERNFWGAIWRAAAGSILAAIALWALRPVLPILPTPFWRLVFHSGIYGAIYLTLWLLLPGGRKDFGLFWRQTRQLRASADPRP
ncbi:MAG TPA: lipopolysaccharide biosynthesis protein [Tepidisphaeraceae bacterium]|nr:lipopolysaccharide biosynthesis protein [Tepidisphaeraceae bacterium]